MIIQFLEALVETVDGKEESFRIGDVNRHRHIQRSARLPHGVEAFVIHFHEWPRRDVLAQVESQRFQDLQSSRPKFLSLSHLIRLNLTVSRGSGAPPPRLSKLPYGCST